MPLTLPLPEALRRLLDQVLTGGDAMLDGPGAHAALDGAATLLAAQRCRVLRASAAGPGGLDLSGLMAQVTRQPDLPNPSLPDPSLPDPSLPGGDGASLEQGAQALTHLDDGCDRVVLLLDGAGDLPAVTLRYLQLTCRTSASLRLVLVGRPEALDGPEFGYLRARLLARPVLVPEDPGAAPPSAGASLPGLVALPAERSRPSAVTAGRMRSAAAVLGMAICLGLGVFIGQQAPALPAAPTPAAPTSVAAAPAATPPVALVDAAAAALPMAVADTPAPATDPAGPRTVAPATPLGAASAPVAASLGLASTRVPFGTPSPPMRQPPQPAALSAELFPVPPMLPNRAAPVYRRADARRRDSLVAAGRAWFPRPAVARLSTRARSLARAYEPRTTQWDDLYGPGPGWQSGDRNWPQPRIYPGDAYAGRDYPYGP